MIRLKSLQILSVGLVVLAASCSYLSPGVKVVFRNQSSETLTSVRITYVGGEHVETNLPPRSHFRMTVIPTDESSIEVNVSYDNQQVSTNLAEYLEAGYRGKITVIFGNNHKIKHRSGLII